jgi:hypothetical protein
MKWLKYEEYDELGLWKYRPLYKNKYTDKQNAEYFIQDENDKYEATYIDEESWKIINQNKVPSIIIAAEKKSLIRRIQNIKNMSEQLLKGGEPKWKKMI